MSLRTWFSKRLSRLFRYTWLEQFSTLSELRKPRPCRLGLESLETRIVLDATSFAGGSLAGAGRIALLGPADSALR